MHMFLHYSPFNPQSLSTYFMIGSELKKDSKDEFRALALDSTCLPRHLTCPDLLLVLVRPPLVLRADDQGGVGSGE